MKCRAKISEPPIRKSRVNGTEILALLVRRVAASATNSRQRIYPPHLHCLIDAYASWSLRLRPS